jgi:hypothetical protein
MAEGVVGLFRKKTLNDLIPIHPDNIGNKDWVILLEAGTIVGPSPQRIRVARCIHEKNILKKSDMLLRTKHCMVIEGYNPRIPQFTSAHSSSDMTPTSSCRWRATRLAS